MGQSRGHRKLRKVMGDLVYAVRFLQFSPTISPFLGGKCLKLLLLWHCSVFCCPGAKPHFLRIILISVIRVVPKNVYQYGDRHFMYINAFWMWDIQPIHHALWSSETLGWWKKKIIISPTNFDHPKCTPHLNPFGHYLFSGCRKGVKKLWHSRA